MRPDKDSYYLDIARSISTRSTCLRRKYGAVIVKNDEIIATGYNGTPRNTTNCIDLGKCDREILKVPKGERYELCRGVHAEQNAMLSAARKDMMGAKIYINGTEVVTGNIPDCEPCIICRRLILNSGISEVIFKTTEGYRVDNYDYMYSKMGNRE